MVKKILKNEKPVDLNGIAKYSESQTEDHSAICGDLCPQIDTVLRKATSKTWHSTTFPWKGKPNDCATGRHRHTASSWHRQCRRDLPERRRRHRDRATNFHSFSNDGRSNLYSASTIILAASLWIGSCSCFTNRGRPIMIWSNRHHDANAFDLEGCLNMNFKLVFVFAKGAQTDP